jgi:hypothetical protein
MQHPALIADYEPGKDRSQAESALIGIGLGVVSAWLLQTRRIDH